MIKKLKADENDKLYDLDDYEEIDPRSRFVPTVKTAEVYTGEPELILHQINKVAKVMRQIAPRAQYETNENMKLVLEEA